MKQNYEEYFISSDMNEIEREEKKRLTCKVFFWGGNIVPARNVVLQQTLTLIIHLYLINILLLCPLSRKGPNARHTGAPVAHSSCS